MIIFIIIIMKLTVDAIEDHTIVPDFKYRFRFRFWQICEICKHRFFRRSHRCAACSSDYLATMVMSKIFNIFCHIFKSIHTGVLDLTDMWDLQAREEQNILPFALEFAVWKTGWLWLAFNVDANTENLKLLHLRVSTEN